MIYIYIYSIFKQKVLEGRTDSQTCCIAGGIPKPSKCKNSLYTLLAKGLAGFVPEGSWTYFGPSLFLHKGIHDDVGTAKRSFQEETYLSTPNTQVNQIHIKRSATSSHLHPQNQHIDNEHETTCLRSPIHWTLLLFGGHIWHTFFSTNANQFVLAISVGSFVCYQEPEITSKLLYQEPGDGVGKS